MQFIRRAYGFLLFLFPRTYREEYGSELQAVFDLLLEDALKNGLFDILVVALHELMSLPKAIVIQHLRESRKAHMVKKFRAYFNFTHGSRREFLMGIYPFLLLGGVLPVINILGQSGLVPVPNPWFDGIGIILLAILGFLLLSGFVTGLPRWSLPNAGFLLSLISAYGFSEWLNRWRIIPFESLYSRSWFLGQVAYQGSLWVGLTVMSLVLVGLFAFVPVLCRFKRDWTLLPFILYGATPFALVFTFDDYVREEPYELVAFLILVAGVWFYLRTDDPRWRFGALFGGMTVSLFLAAVAKAIIFSSPSWPYPRFSFSWQSEMISTVIMWMWIALSMLVSALLSLNSEPEESSQMA